MSERGREGEGGGGSQGTQGTKSAKDLMFLSVGASNHPIPPPLLCCFEASTAAVQQGEDWRQERFFVKDRVSCCVAD